MRKYNYPQYDQTVLSYFHWMGAKNLCSRVLKKKKKTYFKEKIEEY